MGNAKVINEHGKENIEKIGIGLMLAGLAYEGLFGVTLGQSWKPSAKKMKRNDMGFDRSRIEQAQRCDMRFFRGKQERLKAW